MTDPVDMGGGLWPVGIPTSHTWREIGAILWIVQTFHLRAVVELGIEQGGLGALLQAHRGIAYLGLEYDASKVHASVGGIRIADVFDKQTLFDVLTWIEGRRPVLVYCDDGDKPRELATYGPILRPGDVLGTHDVGSEVKEADLAMLVPEAWMRVTGPWVTNTRQAFFIRS